MKLDIMRTCCFLVVTVMVVSSFLMMIPCPGKLNVTSDRGTRQAFTHGVLAEDITQTTCVYCPTASDQLKSIYDSGDYPFYLVSLIEDVNNEAKSRISDGYGDVRYPTVEFDGGYRTKIGAQSDESIYRQDIEDCGERNVPDLVIHIDIDHLYDATLNISIDIENNDAAFSGRLRVYVTETVSRYDDNDGNPYPFGFLSFAFNEQISISSGGQLDKSTKWNGSEHQDALEDDFGDINPANIMIIAAVFNNEDRAVQTVGCLVGEEATSHTLEYDVTISDVSHNPQSPTTKDQITISATVTGDVSEVKVTVCSVIEGTCFVSEEMSAESGNRYTAVVGPYDKGDYEYHITVTDPGDITHKSEDFTFTVSDEDTDGKTGFIPGFTESESYLLLIGIVIAVLIIVIAVLLARKAGSKKEAHDSSSPVKGTKSSTQADMDSGTTGKITCPSCSNIFPVPKGPRPIQVQCPNCGTKGMI